ncbi:hypothetical protein B0H10DRAFT_2252350 [Mycena sp. CBHHK59/15]|nr:hypothetical protein B0H10DRAFT_2252350 [Mycena sp. CBHHK59/15]
MYALLPTAVDRRPRISPLQQSRVGANFRVMVVVQQLTPSIGGAVKRVEDRSTDFVPASSLSVSVEIGPWDYTGGDNEPSASISFPVPHSDVHVIDEPPDIDARLGWEWKPSNIKWLDPGVSSQVTDFPHGMKLTDKTKIYALHRVKGCPSQFPFFSKRTAYLVDLTEMSDLDPEMTVDDTLRDQDSHSWLGSKGARNAPDAHIPGSFFGLTDDIKVACRRAAPFCAGVSACEALDSAFLAEERRELDPEPSRKLAAAVLRTREMQDDTDVGRTLAFYHSLQKWRCNGIRADGVQCDVSISLHKLNTPMRNKEHILLCSKRNEALIFNSLHSQVLILDHVSEEIFVKVMNGESIIEEDDTEGKCPRVVSARTGQKGKHRCPFNHHKNGRPYVAQIELVTCAAKMMIFCPWESLHPTLARMALVVPYPKSGHTHPPPPAGKITQAVAARYRQCVRKIGLGATVSKVENGGNYYPSAAEFLLTICSTINQGSARREDTRSISSGAAQPRRQDSTHPAG